MTMIKVNLDLWHVLFQFVTQPNIHVSPKIHKTLQKQSLYGRKLPSESYFQKALHGRSDQVYCNDYCRNIYNRNKKAYEKIDPHPSAPEIFRIIKKNYELLKQGFPGQIEEKYYTVFDTEVFVNSDINLKFYTSSFESGDKQWYCVFDRCYSN